MTAMYPRLLGTLRSSFLLLGPRGTGKSTWVTERFPDARTIDLLEEGRFQRYLADIKSLLAGDLCAPTWLLGRRR